jgi:hypothetical protein
MTHSHQATAIDGAHVGFVQSRRRAGLSSRLLRPRIAATLKAGALALFGGSGRVRSVPRRGSTVEAWVPDDCPVVLPEPEVSSAPA